MFNKALKEEIEWLKSELEFYKKKYEQKQLKTVEAVIASRIGKGIEWYNYQDLPPADKVRYFNDSQAILKNETFRNEYDRYIADIIKHIAKQSKSWEEIQFLRATIMGLEVLRERLESIENPLKQVSKENINDAI